MRAKFGGAPLGKTYWSTHRIGSRQRLKHVQRKGALPFFSYMDDTVPVAGDGGESLSHELYKLAIARLRKTQLRLRSGSHDIRITHAETEKTINLPSGHYRPDVYLRFECDGWLSNKWGGELYLEVWHAHRVPVEKIKDLAAHRIPVIEVKVSDAFHYRYDGDTTTDEREEQHVTYLVGRLEEFIVGQVLSNPSSVPYLEEQVRALATKLAAQEKSVLVKTEEIGKLEGTIRALEADAEALRQDRDTMSIKLQQQRDSLEGKIALLSRKATLDERKMQELEGEVKGLKKKNVDLQEQMHERTRFMLLVMSSVFVCGVIAVYRLFG